jgi:NADH-quinone oxidoreductase subunit J
MSAYAFYILGALSVILSLFMVSAKNPVHCVLLLIATFFTIAGQFLLLNAQFLAAVHIIVYAGAIMVLFLFVLMMLNIGRETTLLRKSVAGRVAVTVAAGMLLITLLGAFRGSAELATGNQHDTQIGTVERLGKVLFTDFVVPFEIAGILFLAAMVGAVLVSKRDLKV